MKDEAERRIDNPLVFYLLITAIPLILVLLVVGFSALPPYRPSQAQAQPEPVGTTPAATGSPRASAAPSVPAAGAAPVAFYEAEDKAHNTLGATTRLRTVAGASGGLVVTRVGHGTSAGDLTFGAVTAPAAGRYTLTVYYLLAGGRARRLALSVDGHASGMLTFQPLRSADRIGTVRATVALAAGTNTIRFSDAAGKAYGPDLDRIAVQRR
ncbi:MAG: hypothetical protein V7603_2721 [Micromonosporaceae bacterium]